MAVDITTDRPSPLHRLPEELLLQISTYFLIEDLSALNLTCRLLRKIVYTQFQYHGTLKRKYNHLSDKSFKAKEHELGWFSVLVELLRGDFPIGYVSALTITNCPWYWDELPHLAHLSFSETKKPYNQEDMDLAVRAALTSPWIFRDGTRPCGDNSNALNMSSFVAEIQEGDMDNILAVLLPLLTGLKHIELHEEHGETTNRNWLGSVPGVLRRIASSTVDPSRNHDILRVENPGPYSAFQCLRSIRVDFTGLSNNPFEASIFRELVPWIALPSLRRVDAIEAHERRSAWREARGLGLPKSNVQDIRFYNRERTLSLETAVALAKMCAGPCLITQRNPDGSFVKPPLQETMYSWQFVKVEPDGRIKTLGGVLP